MLLFYAHYTIFIWLLIGSNHGDILLMRQLSEDQELLGIAACTKRCMLNTDLKNSSDSQMSPPYFRVCFDRCKDNEKLEDSTEAPKKIRKIQENFHLKLVCRTDLSLTFRIDWVEHDYGRLPADIGKHTRVADATNDALYIVKVTAAQGSDEETVIYLSDDNFFTIFKLNANTAHNISALAVHSDGDYSIIAREQTFKTLKLGYQPSTVGSVKLNEFVRREGVGQSIAAEIEWQPSADSNCFYDMVFPQAIMGVVDPIQFRNPRKLFRHIEDIEFDKEYCVGVRAINPKNFAESNATWVTFRAPTCLEWFHFNYTLCAPLKPSNVSVLQDHYLEGILSLNISWSQPIYLPDYYALHILDLHEDSLGALFNVSKNATYFYIPEIQILGKNFEVHLVAHTLGGENATVVFLNKEPRIDESFNRLMLFMIVLVCCFFVLTLFTLCKRKAKLKRYRQRCKYLEAEEQKKAQSLQTNNHLSLMDNSSCLLTTLQAENSLELSDELEVEPQEVQLQDVLGEGAFGLVRRGVYKKRQVAVKLLKDEPNGEDVQAFRCEIKMLRSVGKHPNIVGMVGYSTKCAKRMMLLIEYCSLGNLQNFLREEWKFRQEKLSKKVNKVKEQRKRSVPKLKQLDRELPHGTRIEDLNCSVVEPSDVDLEQTRLDNALNQFVALAADNKSYGFDIENLDANNAPCLDAVLAHCHTKADKDQPATVTVENREYFGISMESTEALSKNADKAREPLKYVDLLDIAQQVAMGMEFLAQNKVVHRDLAARNVLISLDRTIKIADFGLSRDVYHENVYRKSGGGKLPIKWLALESLTHQVYTSQSDVWSFGVLLYEITTLGGMPYPSVSPGDLLQLLRQGQRMKRPEGCTDEMFALMENCWCSIPAQRPTFTTLKQQLSALILATGELPYRQKQQQNAKEQLSELQNKVDQLVCSDEGHYLQPLQ